MSGSSLAKFFKGKKVLVTGHTGFKGSWLSLILLKLGASVSGYSLAPDTTPNLYSLLGIDNEIHSNIADIRDYEVLSAIFRKEKPEIVLHLAAQPLVRPSYEDPLYTFSTNVMGTVNVLECVRQSKSAKASVIITTDKVYEVKDGAPHRETDELGGYDPYSSSKVCAEHIIRSYIRSYFNPDKEKSTPQSFIASARAGNVIGGGDWSKDRIVPDIMRALFERKNKIVLRNPSAIRPWQHVLDPLFGYLLLAKKLYEEDLGAMGAWNFAPEEGNFVTVEELTKRSIRVLGMGSYVTIPDSGKHETEILRLDSSKVKAYLGWKPILNIDECISWSAEWYRSFYLGQNAREITENQIGSFLRRISYG